MNDQHIIPETNFNIFKCPGFHSYVDLPGYTAMMGTLFRDPQEGEPGVQTIPLTKIVCGPSESQLVMLQLE